MAVFLQDLKYGIRTMIKARGFTAVAVLVLALGIGANTAIFSVVNAVILAPLPYEDPDRLVVLAERGRTLEVMSVAWPNFVDWREQSTVFDSMALFRFESFNLTGTDEPERLGGRACTASYPAVLGVPPLLGRSFLPDEDRPGAARVVMLSEGLWRRRFGADEGILGRPITLNGEPHVVVGVIPASLAGFQGTDLYVPLGPRVEQFTMRGSHPGLWGIARLRPGVTPDQARAEMDTIAGRLGRQYPDSNEGSTVSVDLLRDSFFSGFRPMLMILFGAVAFVLLIASANVANLMLARAAGRRSEMAIRAALGAGRSRLVRQLLTESLVLALAGGGLGLLLAVWGTEALVAAGPANLPRIDQVRIDGTVLGFTFAVTVLTGLLFGLLPALHVSKTDLHQALKEWGRGTAGGRGRLRQGLVIAEIALTLVLLAGTGLLAQSFLRLSRVDPGFDPEGVLTVTLSVPAARYPALEQWRSFHEQVLDRIHGLPGVRSAAVAWGIPLGGGGSEASFRVEGRPEPDKGEAPFAQAVIISPDYFQTLGIPLMRGRWFTERDDAGAPSRVVVDELLASQHWPGEDPIGKRIDLEGDPASRRWSEVIGVVGHTKHYGLDARDVPQLYVPIRQMPEGPASRRPDMTIFVRAGGGLEGLVDGVRRAIWSLDKDQPIFRARRMEEFVSSQTAQRRFSALMLGLFSTVALILAAVGIYGVISYSVSQRTHEIGVRMALGAGRGDVLRMVTGQGLRLVLIGVPVGLAASFGLTRLLSSLLFGVSATDPLTLAAVSALLGCVALLACYMPARRALRVDPTVALRYE